MPRIPGYKLPTFCALLGVFLLTGCSSGAYDDRRREAGEDKLTFVGDSTPDAPSICYNSLTSTPQDVIRIARDICAKTNRVPVLVKQSKFDCTLLYPSRADYRCVPFGTYGLSNSGLTP